ncbi:hypothetical protein BurJ1DRAFT_3147 [Burkholderiales bacterium JOSHI_001]|nr:hypothetical protein BurJ1DRAFT_3147 [Burkholderiales bacterium JOSHI_001]
MRLLSLGAVFVSLLVPTASQAADATDLDALSLADQAGDNKVQPARAWRLFLEGARGRSTSRTDGSSVDFSRASIDLRYDRKLGEAWRVVVSNRLDGVDDKAEPGAPSMNTLREAYVSWSPAPDLSFDLGRVNLRQGVAMGYNPTDWFKENALRANFTPDPMALRENRQGTVVVQGQKVWPGASASLALSPKLSSEVATDTWALNAGATNPSDRWLLVASAKLGAGFNPQLLVHGARDQSTQWGLNASVLAGDATSVFAEWSTGRGPSLISRALALAQGEQRQERAALGLTYTLPINLALTAELEYNGSAPTGDQWRVLGGTPLGQLRVLGAAQSLQDLPARRAWFVHAQWKDAVFSRLDVSAFARHEDQTHSTAQWLELRYRLQKMDLALQCQWFTGSAGSVFGSVPNRRVVDLSLRWYP